MRLKGRELLFKHEKFLGILVVGLLKSYPIDYGTTGARLEHREIV